MSDPAPYQDPADAERARHAICRAIMDSTQAMSYALAGLHMDHVISAIVANPEAKKDYEMLMFYIGCANERFADLLKRF